MVDQVYCVNDYWLDYPRKDRVKIDNIKGITEEEKSQLRNGKTIAKSDRGGSYTQYYHPIIYDAIRG